MLLDTFYLDTVNMAENKLKVSENKERPLTKRRKRSGKSMFSSWSLGGFWLFQNLPYVFYLTLLAVVYIANSNYAFQNIQDVKRLQNELNKISWECNFKKSELMFESTQSRVNEKVHHLGLQRLDERPKKILMEGE